MSNHRSGRAPGFSALRPHKSLAQGSQADPASTTAATSSTSPNASAAAQPVGPSRHGPWVHANLLEQEAARRASAPPLPPAMRKAPLTAPATLTQKHLRAGAAPAAPLTGGSGVGGDLGGDLEMADAPGAAGATAAAPHALLGAGGSRAVGNGQSKAGAGDGGRQSDEAAVKAQAEAGGGGVAQEADARILLKDLLLVLEKEVCTVRSCALLCSACLA